PECFGMKWSFLVAAGLLMAALALFAVDSIPAATEAAAAPAINRLAQLDPTGESESEAAVDSAIAPSDATDSAPQQAGSGDESVNETPGEKSPAIDWNIVTNPAFILMMLGLNVIVAELLSRHTVFRHFGTTMTVLVTTAIAA